MTSEEKITINSIDMESQIGESEILLGQIRTMVRQNKLVALAAAAIVVIALAAIFVPLAVLYDPYAQTLTDGLQAPSAAHILGMDELGKSVFSRVIYGARVSLMVGSAPTVISMAIGTILGLLVGFYGGKTNFVIIRLADVMLAFPSLLPAMVITYTVGGGLVSISMVLIPVNWTGTAWIVRSQIPSLKEVEYVETTRSMGVEK